MDTDETLSNVTLEHLEKALQAEDPSEKNFHIRQVLQASVAD